MTREIIFKIVHSRESGPIQQTIEFILEHCVFTTYVCPSYSFVFSHLPCIFLCIGICLLKVCTRIFAGEPQTRFIDFQSQSYQQFEW